MHWLMVLPFLITVGRITAADYGCPFITPTARLHRRPPPCPSLHKQRINMFDALTRDKTWGPCKTCKMWQIEPNDEIAGETVGVCIAEKLNKYQLRVSGDSGCNVYKEGEVKRRERSSETPPPEEILDPPTG
jgi:hypothetical protein